MGWQDSPVVKEGVPDVRPSWMSSPVAPAASAAPKPAESGFLHTLLGEGELGGAAVGNIIPNAINSANDILNRIYPGGAIGGAPKEGAPGPVPTFHVGQAGKDMVSDVKGFFPGTKNGLDVSDQELRDNLDPGGTRPIEELRAQYAPEQKKPLKQVLSEQGTLGGDIASGVLGVGGDVGNILPATSLAKGAAGLMGGAGEAAGGAAPTIDDALTKVGYRNLPRQGDGSAAAKLGAKITGEQPLAQQHTLNNQAVTDALAKHEAQIPQHSDLDYQSLAASRAAGPGKVYSAAEAAMPDTMVHDPKLTSDLGSVGDTTSQLPKSPDVDLLKQTMLEQPNMTRDQLFNNIRQARDRAARFYASDQPDAHAIGDAYQGVANAYEDFVGRQLANAPGAPVTLADWQAARMAFAKNYAVQGAVRGTSVNASKLAAIQSKDPERLTGGLRLIAEQQNRYPLSTGFGPTTFEPGGVGASGTPQGIIARHVTGPLLGAGVGTLVGGPAGGLVGGATGLLGSELFQSVIRKALGGNPLKSAAMAEAATKNPDLASFFDQEVKPNQVQTPPLELQPPPGRAFEPHQPDLATGTGERNFFGTGANAVPGAGPMGAPPAAASHPGQISLMDLLSHGVEQEPAAGLTAGPMGAPAAEGIPFQRDAAHEAGDLSLMDVLSGARRDMSLSPTERALESERVHSLRAREEGIEPEFEPEHIPGRAAEHEGTVARRMAEQPTLMDMLENLRDHPDVMSQGVPEGIMTRTANNASGESPASLEAINRTTREQASGQDRFLIDPDGKMWPIRGVEAADAHAPKGSIIVQKGIGGSPYTILDRGGLPHSHANGLMNRALAGGHGMNLMDLLEGSGG